MVVITSTSFFLSSHLTFLCQDLPMIGKLPIKDDAVEGEHKINSWPCLAAN